MKDKYTKFIIKGLWIAFILMIIIYILFPFSTISDFFGNVGKVISITVILMGMYDKIIWKYNPLEKIPRIMGTYCGKIEYSYNGIADEKNVSVNIKQTLLSVNVRIKTNEIISNTIVSDLIEENDQYVLYYTYITNPKSKYSIENPIQYGTCRIEICSGSSLKGIYWTSRKTIGDIELTKVE